MRLKSIQGVANLKLPADLYGVLNSSPKAMIKWVDLTPIARRDFISWIDSAKKEETRQNRIKRTLQMLLAGKRRPCCYSIVPMDLYKVLGAKPRAKAQLSKLTSNERRDLLDWVESAKNSDARRKRIEKVCAILASGKKNF